MNLSKPQVSVVIPNYNYGRFLRKRLRTVLDQEVILGRREPDAGIASSEDVAPSGGLAARCRFEVGIDQGPGPARACGDGGRRLRLR